MIGPAGAPAIERTVPELGTSLGSLIAPAAPGAAGAVPLDDIRLTLVTELFELAGAARAFGIDDDPAAALASLSRRSWLEVWERALASAAARVADHLDARLASAAAESRYPRRRLRRERLSAGERQAIQARLAAGAADFVAALDALDATVPGASAAGTRGRDALAAWRIALVAAARRLETAWRALESAAVAEQRRWDAVVLMVHRWRRPRWPLWLLSGALLLPALYLGLVLGGYLPVPAPLRGLVESVWRRT